MIYVLNGRREVGKTTLALYLASRVPTRVIFDPRGLVPASDRALTANDVADQFTRMREANPTRSIVVTPDSDVKGLFEYTARECKEWARDAEGPIAFVVDEVRFIDTESPALDWLLRCAARSEVTIIFTAHRPSDLPPDIRAIADYWCLFTITQEHDLKVIRERCSDEVAARVQRLKSREFLTWDDTTGTFREYRDPSQWFVKLATDKDVRSTRAALADLHASETDVDTSKLF